MQVEFVFSEGCQESLIFIFMFWIMFDSAQ